MGLNPRKIEQTSKNILEIVLSKSEVIFTNIAENDKTPSVDGTVSLYKKIYNEKGSISDKKDNLIGNIDIQLKGKYIEDINKLKVVSIKYSVEISDLKNYRGNGGVVYFVVCFYDFNNYTIYYDSLLPLDLEEILRKVKPKQKSTSIKLRKFSENVTHMEKIFKMFIENSKLQQSTANHGYYSMNDLKIIPNIVFKPDFEINPMPINDGFFSCPLYLYRPIGNNIYEPLSKCFIEEYVIEKQILVKLDGKTYYQSIRGGRNKENYKLAFGASFDILIPLNRTLGMRLNWNISGTLKQRLEDSKFFFDLLKSYDLEIGDFLKCEVKNFNIDSQNKEVAKNIWEFYSAVNMLFDKLKIKNELDFKNLSNEDELNIMILKKAIVDGMEISISDIPYNIAISSKKIANIDFKCIIEKKSGGKYRIYNFFDDYYKMSNVTYKEDGYDDIQFPICALLKKEDFLKFNNIDYDGIFQEISKMEISSDRLNGYITFYILDMLKAYDENKNEDLLNCIIKITEMISKKDSTSIIAYINYLQAVFRKRKLSESETIKLLDMSDSGDYDDKISLAVAILLKNNTIVIKRLFDKLSVEDRMVFKNYPIANISSCKNEIMK